MRKITLFIAVVLTFIIIHSCGKSVSSSDPSLQKEMNEYIEGKDANIGVAVIIDRKDTIEVNGNQAFPMLSVYKFPIAVALGDYLRVSNELVADPITITQKDLKPDTYSPMREKYEGVESFKLSLYDIIAYAIQQSDNNASDILLKIMGGTENAMLSLKRLGIENINVVSTEEEMHEDNQRCYDNSATPIAMAQLLDCFDHEFEDLYTRNVKQLMETCATGVNRLAKPLTDTDAIIGHKTGTGFILSDGRLMAINDVGYVHLPNGRIYSIAVFIENSGYDIQ
ncbi:MAG: class A beta-lactamase-related serine hydrolase [Muribaculaceae bacterium]|nr:class A beta-lactamase-related serine hydrolase [Muribaculaceae bacterium]